MGATTSTISGPSDPWCLADGIISSTIDEARNRLVYGVLAEQGHIVEDFFSSLNLPCDLLLLEADSIPLNLQNVLILF